VKLRQSIYEREAKSGCNAPEQNYRFLLMKLRKGTAHLISKVIPKERPTDLTRFNHRSTAGAAGFSADYISIEDKTALAMYDSLVKSLDRLKGCQIERLLDLGCGRAALHAMIADRLSIPETYGVDIDQTKLEIAKRRIPVVRLDLEYGLPFSDSTFDLVTSFGVFEHMKFFDKPIEEAHRVLKDGGFFLVCMPNLGSYSNRMQLLLGYQPRDVEISRLTVAGVARKFLEKDVALTGHVHAATLGGLTALLEFHGFRVVNVTGGSTMFNFQSGGLLVRIMDFLTSKRPSLSRRIFVLSRKIVRLPR